MIVLVGHRRNYGVEDLIAVGYVLPVLLSYGVHFIHQQNALLCLLYERSGADGGRAYIFTDQLVTGAYNGVTGADYTLSLEYASDKVRNGCLAHAGRPFKNEIRHTAYVPAVRDRFKSVNSQLGAPVIVVCALGIEHTPAGNETVYNIVGRFPSPLFSQYLHGVRVVL